VTTRIKKQLKEADNGNYALMSFKKLWS